MTPKIHVALNVNNLGESIAFYRALWGAEPVKVRTGYAKFDVAAPAVNLTLNENPVRELGGINHFGIQVGDSETVWKMQQRLEARGLKIALEERQTDCCYAIQDKVWVTDPNGYRWEVFVVLEDNLPEQATSPPAACCVAGPDALVQLGGGAQ